MNSPYETVNAMAARICGMKPVFEPPNKQTTVPADLYQYQYVDGDGLTLDCHLEYEAAHDGGTGPDSDESYPKSITLIYALCNGVDISNVLSQEVTETIEGEAEASMCMDGWDDQYDLAAARAEQGETA